MRVLDQAVCAGCTHAARQHRIVGVAGGSLLDQVRTDDVLTEEGLSEGEWWAICDHEDCYCRGWILAHEGIDD